MIPILYEQTEVNFVSNGIGRLVDSLSCAVTEERNGIYELELTYPTTGRHYDSLVIGAIISATHSERADRQPFIIYRKTIPIDGIVTINAHHISYRLNSTVLKPFVAHGISEAMQLIRDNTVNQTPFDFWTDKTTDTLYTLQVPKSVRQVLGGEEGSILDIFGGGEYEFDKFTVKLYQNRGHDSGVELRLNKNLIDLNFETGNELPYNAVVPYWKNNETQEVKTLPDYIVTIAPGDQRPIPLDLTESFDREPTDAEMEAAARKHLADAKGWLTTDTVTVDFVQLWQMAEYKDFAPLERVGLCDTVTISLPQFGVKAKKKVVKVVYDTLSERYIKLELGATTQSLADVIDNRSDKRLNQAMANVVTYSKLDDAATSATAKLFNGAGGHVVYGFQNDKPSEIFVMDTADINTAVNVLRINYSGIGFSRSGINGPYDTAWTIDGQFNADFISGGTISGVHFDGVTGSFSQALSINSLSDEFETRITTDLNGMAITALDQSESYPVAVAQLILNKQNALLAHAKRIQISAGGSEEYGVVSIDGAPIYVNATPLTPHALTLSYVDNVYISKTEFEKIKAYATGFLSVFDFQCNISLPANSQNLVIGTVNITTLYDTTAIIRGQTQSQIGVIEIKTDGTMLLRNLTNTNASGLYSDIITVPISRVIIQGG